mmetsp:Transcript_8231/g.19902  ORF Transcript_8231/g.19902 Transcript_8231/m.19902 type:complete len:372 (-) Transcript_8231:589-1704(-)
MRTAHLMCSCCARVLLFPAAPASFCLVRRARPRRPRRAAHAKGIARRRTVAHVVASDGSALRGCDHALQCFNGAPRQRARAAVRRFIGRALLGQATGLAQKILPTLADSFGANIRRLGGCSAAGGARADGWHTKTHAARYTGAAHPGLVSARAPRRRCHERRQCEHQHCQRSAVGDPFARRHRRARCQPVSVQIWSRAHTRRDTDTGRGVGAHARGATRHTQTTGGRNGGNGVPPVGTYRWGAGGPSHQAALRVDGRDCGAACAWRARGRASRGRPTLSRTGRQPVPRRADQHRQLSARPLRRADGRRGRAARHRCHAEVGRHRDARVSDPRQVLPRTRHARDRGGNPAASRSFAAQAARRVSAGGHPCPA